jgi:hypothetical protein
MAQKRALVAAVLITVNASEFFTQDVEDMDPALFSNKPPESPQTTEIGLEATVPVEVRERQAPTPEEPNSGELQYADIRTQLKELKKASLGHVLDHAVMTGLYNDREHAKNALLSPEGKWLIDKGLEIDLNRDVKVKGRMMVFDWLISRKLEGEDEEE